MTKLDDFYYPRVLIIHNNNEYQHIIDKITSFHEYTNKYVIKRQFGTEITNELFNEIIKTSWEQRNTLLILDDCYREWRSMNSVQNIFYSGKNMGIKTFIVTMPPLPLTPENDLFLN